MDLNLQFTRSDDHTSYNLVVDVRGREHPTEVYIKTRKNTGEILQT